MTLTFRRSTCLSKFFWTWIFQASISSARSFGIITTVLSVLVFVGCQTTGQVEINEVEVPLASIRNIVLGIIPGGVRDQSPNGRELTSNYFSPEDFDKDAEESRVRAYAHITILGHRRPFNIDIKVFREVRERREGKTKYRNTGFDKRTANKIAEILKDALANRPEDRNIIDDFKAF